MTYIRWLNEIGNSDQNWAGEKATVLGELAHAGFSIPHGFCIGASAYHDTFIAHGLSAKIKARLDEIEISDPAQLEQAAEEIRKWIAQVPLHSELDIEIQSALAQLTAPLTAVRLSRISHDVPNPSASGSPQAYLGIRSAAVLDHLRQCWTAPWNSRAIYFRHRKKIPFEQVSLAVVVQTMINSDAAGVMFTASPMGKNPGQIHIDGIWGLGEAVIAARWRPDHFVVDKATGAVGEKNIVSKTVMDVAAVEGGVHTVGVSDERQNIACLTDAQVSALAELGKKAEALFRSSQDIEWCLQGNNFYVLQSRPIKS